MEMALECERYRNGCGEEEVDGGGGRGGEKKAAEAWPVNTPSAS